MKKKNKRTVWLLSTLVVCVTVAVVFLITYRLPDRLPASDELTIPHHEKLWALPDKHGTAYLSGETGCMRCHGEGGPVKKKYPEYFIQCNSCHTAFPHDDNIVDAHPEMARRYEGQCTNCHKPIKDENGKDSFRLLPNMEGEGCYFCHDRANKPTATWEEKE